MIERLEYTLFLPPSCPTNQDHLKETRTTSLYPLETCPLKVEPVHKGVYETNRIVRAHPVVHGIRKKQLLRTIIA